MRILCTNDDGVHGPGLSVLENIARQLSDDVWVVAPDYDQSGVSHSLSLNDPMRLREISPKHYAVRGTPSDCVIMAVRHLMQDKAPDLVLSGVNRGQNIAEDVIYSGTVAGAVEATIIGIPAIAMSQAYDHRARASVPWNCAEMHGAEVVRKILEIGIPKGGCINVNFPGCEPGDVAGIEVVTQGRRSQDIIQVEKREDGRAIPYYWLTFGGRSETWEEGTDLWAVNNRCIAVTPLRIDMTDHSVLAQYAQGFLDKASRS
ncbi:5'/3'-nucleotidase SurE [Microvirga sp. W0021]|uniref:5'-nucleotidase SurE n=1 Tax=Hohaiivirga grylli TaxID=3133970 RepID=A0ABV0BIU9_9HYPH